MKKITFALFVLFLVATPRILMAQASEAPVSGVVFDDKDGNGELGESESAVPGVVISLFAVGSDEPVATVTTGADGAFSFGDLPPGEYQLQIAYPSGLVVKGEVFSVDSDDATQFFAIPVIDRISAPRFTNFTLVNPANTRGEVVSPFAP